MRYTVWRVRKAVVQKAVGKVLAVSLAVSISIVLLGVLNNARR